MHHRATRSTILALFLAASQCAIAQAPAPERWVASWGTSQLVPEGDNALPAPKWRDATLRQLVHLSIGGERLRVRISNVYGSGPLLISAASVGLPLRAPAPELKADSIRALTFAGQSTVTIPAGAEYYSDPVALSVPRAADLAISLHFKGEPARQTGHPGARSTNYLAPGNLVLSAPLPGAETFTRWYHIADVEVAAPAAARSIVAIGDSITDGYGVTADTNSRWTDLFAARLAQSGMADVGVVNAGIGGNRMLRDGLGTNMAARFDRDVLARGGVSHAIVQIGVNDFGVQHRNGDDTPAARETMLGDLKEAYRQLAERAHAKGICLIGGTVTPYAGSGYYKPGPENEALRLSFNAWLRSTPLLDGLADFDAALRDPAQADRLLKALDTGDGLHPSQAGLKAMAEAVPMAALGECRHQRRPRPSGAAQFERFSYEGRSQETVRTGPGEFRNPILSGYYPDPSVTRAGDDYYLINSSFTHFPGIPVFHSRDLVSWQQIGNAVNRPGQFNFKGLHSSRGIFAPDISHHEGVFYIVTTCVDCGGNIVMTATNPAGPWSDPKPIKFNGIDPSIFWDADGKAYIVNNGDPIEKPRYDGHRAIWVQQFDPQSLEMVGERTLIVNGGVDLAAKPIWIEGPHLIKRGQYYYLIAAEGGTGDQHSQVVFRSSSVRGPFLPFAQNPILSQRSLDPKRKNPVTSAGHAKFVQTQDGAWWATFLATRPYADGQYNIGRETFLLPVTWKNDWPMVLESGKAIPFTAPRPKLPPQARPALPFSGDIAYVDEFSGAGLSDQWLGVRTPATPFYSVEGGRLVLSAGGQLGDLKNTPAFIARRQQHHIAQVSTTLRFQPERDGDRAGLVAYQSDASHLFFGLTRIDGQDVVALYTRAKAASDTLVARAPAGAGPITLALQADGGRMSFLYTVDGKTTTLASKVDTTFLSTQKAGGFVGTLIGPYVWRANPG